MNCSIVGAGAVGVVLGLHLEKAGHDVEYVVRAGRREALREITLLDAGTKEAHLRSMPRVREEGEPGETADLVLLCVRGDQIDAALATAKTACPGMRRLGIAAPLELDALARLREDHPDIVFFTFTPVFNAWSDSTGVWTWFHPTGLQNLLSGEGDRNAVEACRSIAPFLSKAGVPARTVGSAHHLLLPVFASGTPFLAAWELAGFGPPVLNGDRALRSITAQAMREAARAVSGEARGMVAFILRHLPVLGFSVVLSLLPLLVSPRLGAMWRSHGPKIAGQTRHMMERLLDQGRKRGVPTPSLEALRQSLRRGGRSVAVTDMDTLASAHRPL
jgi:hypothetical protein